jgi:hypothetical protein
MTTVGECAGNELQFEGGNDGLISQDIKMPTELPKHSPGSDVVGMDCPYP